MAVLEVEGLAVELGGRLALEAVDLAVAAGELVGLIGPNGAGKTTLLRAALGLVPVSAGRVRLQGVPPERACGAVGYVPQRHEFAWDFPCTVAQAVMTGLVRRVGWLRRPGQDHTDRVAQALARVRMSDLAARPIGELSGGQRQRVLVARALALSPTLLLLDEPFTGLDVPAQELLTDLLRSLQGDGHAIIMATHDLPAAAAVCDRLCLLNRTVIADDVPAALQDPGVWLRAFGVTSSDQLLHVLGVQDPGVQDPGVRDSGVPVEPATEVRS